MTEARVQLEIPAKMKVMLVMVALPLTLVEGHGQVLRNHVSRVNSFTPNHNHMRDALLSSHFSEDKTEAQRS